MINDEIYEKNLEILNNEKFYLINLEKRIDRYNRILRDYKFLNIERFKAIEKINGRKGCALSHINLVKYAKDNNMPYIIVLEDDILIENVKYFVNKLTYILIYLKNNINDWEIFNGGITAVNKNTINDLRIVKKGLNLFEYKFGHCLHLVIYNKNSYDKLIELENYYNSVIFIRNTIPIDVIINRLLKKKLMTLPYLCYQKSGFSNIGKRVRNQYQDIKNEENILKRKYRIVLFKKNKI